MKESLSSFQPNDRGETHNLERQGAHEASLYLKYLDLKMEDLRGKKLLDIGAGNGGFVRIAGKEGVDAIALDLEIDNENVERLRKHNEHFVQGTAFQLPFPENCFDYVISVWGPLGNIHWTAEHQSETFQDEMNTFSSKYPAHAEAIRVLKPDGEIRFPFSTNARPDLFARNEIESSFIESLRANQDIELTEKLVEKDAQIYVNLNDDDSEMTPQTRDEYILIIRKK